MTRLLCIIAHRWTAWSGGKWLGDKFIQTRWCRRCRVAEAREVKLP